MLFLRLLALFGFLVSSECFSLPIGSCVDNGVIAFTFDDGVSNNYGLLLDTLKRENIKAGLFIVGNTLYSKYRQNLVKRAVSDGHLVLNHSFSHSNFVKLSEAEIQAEILSTELLFNNIFKKNTIKVIRTPFGSFDDRVLKIIDDIGYKVVLWNMNFFDWRIKKTEDDIVKEFNLKLIKINPQKSSIILLLHDRIKSSVTVIPRLAEEAKKFNFKVIPFHECINPTYRQEIIPHN